MQRVVENLEFHPDGRAMAVGLPVILSMGEMLGCTKILMPLLQPGVVLKSAVSSKFA